MPRGVIASLAHHVQGASNRCNAWVRRQATDPEGQVLLALVSMSADSGLSRLGRPQLQLAKVRRCQLG
jgi:hypothetical protein